MTACIFMFSTFRFQRTPNGPKKCKCHRLALLRARIVICVHAQWIPKAAQPFLKFGLATRLLQPTTRGQPAGHERPIACFQRKKKKKKQLLAFNAQAATSRSPYNFGIAKVSYASWLSTLEPFSSSTPPM